LTSQLVETGKIVKSSTIIMLTWMQPIMVGWFASLITREEKMMDYCRLVCFADKPRAKGKRQCIFGSICFADKSQREKAGDSDSG
jgi:hypothetical protein